MKILFLPQRSDAALSVERQGDSLIINGERFDFAQLQDGETLPRDAIASSWFCRDVERVGGELQVSLVLPLGPRQRRYVDEGVRELVTEMLTHEQCFPEPIGVLEDGPIALPGPAITREPLPEPESDDSGEEVISE